MNSFIEQIKWRGGVYEDTAYDDPDGQESWDYEPPVPGPDADDLDAYGEDAKSYYGMSPSDFTEEVIRFPSAKTRELESFNFRDRPYMRRIYDTPSNRILLMTARQVEKTVLRSSAITLATGEQVLAEDVAVGASLACLSGTGTALGSEMTSGIVLWKSRFYAKPCIEIRTRQGHVCRVARTHPMRTWGAWTEAGDLAVGGRLAVARRLGGDDLWGSEQRSAERVDLTAFLIGDGSCAKSPSLTGVSDGPVLLRAAEHLERIGEPYKTYKKKKSRASSIHLRRLQVATWLREDGLIGKKSDNKFIPPWVFRLSRGQTADFLNALWATDGHVKRNGPTKWSIEYASMSRRLVLDVQALLWKFGIPSKIRENWPSIYKKRGVKKFAYILRVETQDGVRQFIREIGALGKIERQELAPWPENNNRDSLPKEASALIFDLSKQLAPAYGATLHAAGLRRKPGYALTQDKLAKYVQFFDEAGVRDHRLEVLRAHLESDVFWDEITSIEDIGEQECVDFEVRDHHNFVCDGFVTHNSTTLAIKAYTYTCLIPHFKVLYVSPSSTQTKQFSNDRIRELLATSPALRIWYPEHMTDNVFEKKAVNRSQVSLRYAFLNADRCRGLSADMILKDEFQDLLLDNIPVIDEAASHSNHRIFIDSGTPKSEDNPIHHFWSVFSTQNEWAVPCERHGLPRDPSTWHWNILDEANIGKHGLICSKRGCGHAISAMHPLATWVQTNHPHPGGMQIEGFRIPQLMVPWIEWKDLLAKYRDMPRPRFMNEVLARSFDSGQRPLTMEDMQANCDESYEMTKDFITTLMKKISSPIYAGIDWGQDSTKSYTVLVLAAYIDGRFTVFFAQRFEGMDADTKVQIEKIKLLISAFNVRRVGADYGGGHWPNNELLREFGQDRILRFQYAKTSTLMAWDPAVMRYKVHKHEVLGAVFSAIKRRDIFRFPKWDAWKRPFGQDMLSVFSEYNERTRSTEFKKAMNTTDDTMHAVTFAFLASLVENPRPDIFRPSATVDRQVALARALDN